MWYYDPILRIISEKISEERREFFMVKNKMNYSLILEDDIQKKLLAYIGITDEEEKKKLTFKHAVVNIIEGKMVNPAMNPHTYSC
jgi:hypothetical protein